MDQLSAEGISLRFDLAGGIIDDLAITVAGQTIHPLHRAPWIDSGETLAASVAPIERKLAGDFFCAPFARAESGAPIHGWSANGTWQSAGREGTAHGSVTATYTLQETISGAKLTKHITLKPGHPVVYQRHLFEGGEGRLAVGHHAMIRVPGGAKLSFSPKSIARTPPTALETDPVRGRSILAYPQKFPSLVAVRRADGGSVDASRYPFDTGHEDLIVLSEKRGNTVGWSAAVAPAEGFIFFAVKDARVLPQTVLWMSNGGRRYSPWNSRHIAVLGIEEVAADFHLPEGESEAGGLKTGLDLGQGGSMEIRYALGAIPMIAGWTEIEDIAVGETSLTLTDRSGAELTMPFDAKAITG